MTRIRLKYTLLILALAIVFIQRDAWAFKVQPIFLAESVYAADSIAICDVKVQGKSLWCKVLGVLKGNLPPTFKFAITTFIASTEPFSNGERSLLVFRAPETDGTRYLVGHADWGRWPKRQVAWPFQEEDISTIDEVATVVSMLLEVDPTSASALTDLMRRLLRSDSPLQRVVALKYVGTYDDNALVELEREIQAAIEANKEHVAKHRRESPTNEHGQENTPQFSKRPINTQTPATTTVSVPALPTSPTPALNTAPTSSNAPIAKTETLFKSFGAVSSYFLYLILTLIITGIGFYVIIRNKKR